MSAAAVAAGEALGYVGAGTVEFLLTETGEFFFLEVNTRLQVEHPVTELVDRPRPRRAAAARRRGPARCPTRRDAALDGHAVEARLYAEDPANGFLPVDRDADALRASPADGVRVDSASTAARAITPHYDPMIAKVIAHGATRAEAARKLADALRRAEIHGLTTNRDFLVARPRPPGVPAPATPTPASSTATTGGARRAAAAGRAAPPRRGRRRARRPGRAPPGGAGCRRRCRAAGATTRRSAARRRFGERPGRRVRAVAARRARRRCASTETELEAPRLHGATAGRGRPRGRPACAAATASARGTTAPCSSTPTRASSTCARRRASPRRRTPRSRAR